jgi:hypothetical protein
MNGKTEQRASSSGARATTTSAHAHDSAGHTPPPAVNALGGAVQGSSTEMVTTTASIASIFFVEFVDLMR